LVAKVIAKTSLRSFYQVEGSSAFAYSCTRQYCSCPAFFKSVIIRREALYCKHQLAARLSEALAKVAVIEMTDLDWVYALALDKNKIISTRLS